MPSKSKPCHNCRQRRLRCDASIPFCMKCTIANRKCLGYSQLLRWNDSSSTRGCRKPKQPEYLEKAISIKTGRETSPDGSESSCSQSTEEEKRLLSPHGSPDGLRSQLQLSFPLLDPSVQDFTYAARFYLSHCKHLPPDRVRQTISDCSQFIIDCVRIS
jgi:hypothetical protein